MVFSIYGVIVSSKSESNGLMDSSHQSTRIIHQSHEANLFPAVTVPQGRAPACCSHSRISEKGGWGRILEGIGVWGSMI